MGRKRTQLITCVLCVLIPPLIKHNEALPVIETKMRRTPTAFRITILTQLGLEMERKHVIHEILPDVYGGLINFPFVVRMQASPLFVHCTH